MKNSIYISTIVCLLLISCSNLGPNYNIIQDMNNLYGKTITITNDSIYKLLNRFTVLLYIEQSDCTDCILNTSGWKLYQKKNIIKHNTATSILYIMDSCYINQAETISSTLYTEQHFIIDTNRTFKKINKYGKSSILNCILLDSLKVTLIGNIIENSRLDSIANTIIKAQINTP